jgi:biopolymer transport protein ExbD
MERAIVVWCLLCLRRQELNSTFLLMPGNCPNLYGCEWTLAYLWRWMNWLARLDVIILAALLAYTLFLVIRVSYRIHVVQRSQETDRTHRSQLLAEVDVEVANIGSISSTAPYVGLVGTCFGIASVFQGFDLEKHAALVMLTSKVAASLLTAAAGMIVAIAATCSYNYLRTRLDLLENRVPIRGLRLARRISLPPSFALIAAPSLAILVVVYTTFVSFYTPLGFAIEVPSAGCESKTADRMIALHIANGGTLFVDSKHQEWATLESQLSKGHGTRVHRVCLSADENVPFQAVADAIDIVKNTPTAGDVSIATHRRKFDGPKSDEHSLP